VQVSAKRVSDPPDLSGQTLSRCGWVFSSQDVDFRRIYLLFCLLRSSQSFGKVGSYVVDFRTGSNVTDFPLNEDGGLSLRSQCGIKFNADLKGFLPCNRFREEKAILRASRGAEGRPGSS
jgi:hypothetical protein